MWPQSRWVGKGTEFTITAEDDESGVDSIWWWLVNGLSGYKNGFSEGGDKVTFNLTDPNYHVCGFGPWKIEYWAVDNLDNGFTKSEPPIEWAKSQLVLIDNIEPEIENLQP